MKDGHAVRERAARCRPTPRCKRVQHLRLRPPTTACCRSARRRAAATQGANRWPLAGVVQTHVRSRRPERAAACRRLEWTLGARRPTCSTCCWWCRSRCRHGGCTSTSQHLAANKQRTDRYEIALWKKLFYPFAALVMMALALPFAYIQTGTGRVGREALPRHHARHPLPLAEHAFLARRPCSSAGRRSQPRRCRARCSCSRRWR